MLGGKEATHDAGSAFMKFRPILGLFGILLATVAAGFNEQVVAAALSDVTGGFGLSRDAGRWVTTLFDMLQVVGMAVAPALGTALTLRRFSIGVILTTIFLGVLTPNVPSTASFLVLRALQGLAAGLTIPLLLTTALKVLPPPKRLPGLAAYALTSTFSPMLAPTLAALWTDGMLDWKFVFYEVVPIDVIAVVLVWYGADQDAPKYELLSKFDGIGLVLLILSFCPLVVLLEQGDWLDWFNSPFVRALAVSVTVFLPLFVWRQMVASQPIFELDLLKRRNFVYGIVGVTTFVVLAFSGNQIPLAFLQAVRGFKPLQAHVVTLEIALGQVVFLPLAALLLNQRWVDPRWVSAIGYGCVVAACASGAFAVNDWGDAQFFAAQMAQSAGSSFVVLALLVMATNTVTKPEEGAFASAMFNGSRALAGSIAIFLINLIERHRGSLHRDRIVDTIGHVRYRLVQAIPIPGQDPPALTPSGHPVAPGSLAALNDVVMREVDVFTTIDKFLIFGGLAVLVIVVLWVLAERTYPPRIALAQKS